MNVSHWCKQHVARFRQHVFLFFFAVNTWPLLEVEGFQPGTSISSDVAWRPLAFSQTNLATRGFDCHISKFHRLGEYTQPSTTSLAPIGSHAMQSRRKSTSTTKTTMRMSFSTSDGSGRLVSLKSKRVTSVYLLILINLAVYVAWNILHIPFVPRNLYMYHRNWKWWQPLTACFCHADRQHLSNNLFLLLLFGRSVEDDQGGGGLLFSYAFCGIMANLVSLFLLPSHTVGLGASGAVFGLFAISILGKLSWSGLNWRNLVEIAVLGEFVFRQLVTEASTAVSGGTAGVNHVAHLSGAAAGATLMFGLRGVVNRMERTSAPGNR